MLSEKQKNRIEELIKNDIRPFIEADGGKIDLDSITDEGVVYVKLSGACKGCPGASMTLKFGVERILKAQVPEVKYVEMAR